MRFAKLIPILVVIILMLTIGISFGQRSRGKSARPARRAPRHASYPNPLQSMIRDTIDDIQEACPDVNPETLLADVPVVTESAIELRDVFFDRGFGNSEAYEATMYGWKQLRITQLKPSAALTPKQLISLVSGFGKLVIKSSPYGALIVIDGKILPDKTEHVRWETPGTYRLKLTLDGYESHEDQCVVEEGKATYFVKSLNPIKPPKARQKRPRKP